MKGATVYLDKAAKNGGMAALVVDGQLRDVMFDPADDDPRPRPEAIYRAVVDRPLKGMHGAILRLPDGQTAFLKEVKGISSGDTMLVQVTTYAEQGKAAPVTRRVLFKSRYAIITPDAPGINVARSIRDDEERVRLRDIADHEMQGAEHGLILRSNCQGIDDDLIAQDIQAMRKLAETVLADTKGQGAELLLDAPNAIDRAWREWTDECNVVDDDGCLDDNDITEMIDALRDPVHVLQEGGWIAIEPTRAMTCIDVNTGGDFSPAAGVKVNVRAAKAISQQLRMRGLGGQIIIDFAPMGKKDRKMLENTLKASLRKDGIDTIIAGWTPLGNLELQRKRERVPLNEALK